MYISIALQRFLRRPVQAPLLPARPHRLPALCVFLHQPTLKGKRFKKGIIPSPSSSWIELLNINFVKTRLSCLEEQHSVLTSKLRLRPHRVSGTAKAQHNPYSNACYTVHGDSVELRTN